MQLILSRLEPPILSKDHVRRLLRESMAQPVIIEIEDLHWVDRETQEFWDRREGQTALRRRSWKQHCGGRRPGGGKVTQHISNLRAPQGIGFAPESNRLAVANDQDGSCRLYGRHFAAADCDHRSER